MLNSDEQSEALDQMVALSNSFYWQAMRIGVHPFLEFCGLMNEWIKIANHAREAGIDFSDANEHSGIAMPIKSYEARYLGEKFACIFGPTFRANPEAWEIFAAQVMRTE